MELLERYKGSLVGLAVGDALGAPYEFFPKRMIKARVTGMISGGKHGLPKGFWTDDTTQMLLLAMSLIEKKGFDPRDQLEKYLKWMKTGYMSSTGYCFDIGKTTRDALLEFEITGREYSTFVDGAGNGCIMRLAPVPMYFREDPGNAIEMSGLSAKTTHGSITAVDSARYLGAILVGLLNGDSKETVLSENYAPLKGYWQEKPLVGQVARLAAGSFKDITEEEAANSFLAVEALETALWAFHKTSNFMDGALLIVRNGGDADTVAAIYGQIAGAYYGYGAIPQEWRDDLHDIERIEQLALELFEKNSTCEKLKS